MSNLLIYWIFGCALIGFAIGQTIIECPSTRYRSADVAMKVAIWPAFIGMALAGKPPASLTTCEAAE